MSKISREEAVSNKLYVLVWKIQFTVIEEFILKVIEEKQGCADNQIADVLCLNERDISSIISDEGIKDYVQGDSSRRTLISGFTGKEFSVFSSDNYESDKRHYCNHDYLTFFKTLNKLNYTSVPNELQKKKADSYYELDGNMEASQDIVKYLNYSKSNE